MLEWVQKSNALLLESGLTAEIIREAVSSALVEGRLVMRDGLASFFDVLITNDVPLLLFSAGIANVLENALHISLDNESLELNIISNRCLFDSATEAIVAFSKPSLHVFNKKPQEFMDHKFFTNSVSRRNLVLFGDSLGDVNMCSGN